MVFRIGCMFKSCVVAQARFPSTKIQVISFKQKDGVYIHIDSYLGTYMLRNYYYLLAFLFGLFL
jgi:hypothetical protein